MNGERIPTPEVRGSSSGMSIYDGGCSRAHGADAVLLRRVGSGRPFERRKAMRCTLGRFVDAAHIPRRFIFDTVPVFRPVDRDVALQIEVTVGQRATGPRGGSLTDLIVGPLVPLPRHASSIPG